MTRAQDLGVDAVSVELAGTRLVHEVSLAAAAGQVVGLIGPNGSGKSTLLRCVYRVLRPAGGAVRLDGDDLHALTARETARRVAALTQEHSAEFDFTVAEVVAMGRLPHRRGLGAPTEGDRERCAEALRRVRAGHLAERGFLSLSGGEKQRVLFARALVQEPRLLVLDEPTNHLDIAHQLELLALAREAGPTVLTALHDLNLAARHCDLLYVLRAGRIVAAGPPGEVLRPALLAEVFGVRATPVRHPETGTLQLLFDRLPHAERPARPDRSDRSDRPDRSPDA
ncbi:ABC transporter ATP-binding protein [Streptomyces sp. NRRL S-350]|uniref:ABC transporter ATP-binding protein n=1 Tax=Streptomyces sp. NRRL S-350 TaxID=1463902 RepID=UPI00068DF146|nr:ABC transporter ATP-binding protein [Streptomyces sp. NRRL S-350]